MASAKLFILTCFVLLGVTSAQDKPDATKIWNDCKTVNPMPSSATTDAAKCAAMKDVWTVCAINAIKNSRHLMEVTPTLTEKISAEIKTMNITCSITIDKDLMQKAAMSKCKTDNPDSGITDNTKKCQNVDKIMGCVFTRLPPGDADAMKTKLQTEVNTLAGAISGCNAPTIDKAYVTKQVFGECAEAAPKGNQTDKEKCDALKKKATCTIGKVFKSFSSASTAMGTLTTEAKKEAANIKDCKADAAEMLTLARQQLMGGASQAQVSFFAMALTLTAVVMMR